MRSGPQAIDFALTCKPIDHVELANQISDRFRGLWERSGFAEHSTP